VNGYRPISDYLRVLNPEGSYVVAGGSMLQLFQAASAGRKNLRNQRKRVSIASLVQNQNDLILLKELLESGKIVPVIDGCFPMNKTVEALWYFEKVHPTGKVFIIVGQNGK
jgi:NADPH:quinone reductase-like Zn-dependent oxidoreductase